MPLPPHTRPECATNCVWNFLLGPPPPPRARKVKTEQAFGELAGLPNAKKRIPSKAWTPNKNARASMNTRKPTRIHRWYAGGTRTSDSDTYILRHVRARQKRNKRLENTLVLQTQKNKKSNPVKNMVTKNHACPSMNTRKPTQIHRGMRGVCVGYAGGMRGVCGGYAHQIPWF